MKNLIFKLISIIFSICLTAASLYAMDSEVVWNFQETKAQCTCTHGTRISLDSPRLIRSARYDEIFENMLKAPLDLLTKCKSDAQSHAETPDSYTALERKNPIFLLDECTHPGCSMNRTIDRAICPRSFSFDILKTEVLDHLPKKEIILASFASGDLFYDLNLLVKLKEFGYKVTKIILIDRKFANFNLIMKLFENGKFNFDSNIINLQASNAKPLIINQLRRINQFMKAAQALHNDIEILIFEDAIYYVSCVENNLEADVIIALDHLFSDQAREIFLSLEPKRAKHGKLIEFFGITDPITKTRAEFLIY